ncbi:MAG: hypothetical protein KGN79_04370 [Acidobacteriota bacterium]|nr:hypothetical protein [Acidobacteriota bacterium]
MSRRLFWIGSFIFALACTAAIQAQDAAAPSTQPDQGMANDIPMDRAGVMLHDKDWHDLRSQYPAKTRMPHSFAASLSYGIVPAKLVADYEGEHAPTQTTEQRPTICICHFASIPGQPVIVRLHIKKSIRELNGGKMIVYPIVGGSKMTEAQKSDLIPADVEQQGQQVWLIRPQVALEPGEYALMLGTQNLAIFPFTVEGPTDSSPAKK